MPNKKNIGDLMYSWASDLFPYCRSITGPGLRDTLKYLQNLVPELKILSVPSGTKVFDWTVPNEWFIRDAFISDEFGNKVVDFQENNLHLVGYSEPVDQLMSLNELDPYLHSLPDIPDAIPYLTSYYSKEWGFCLTHNQRKSLKNVKYHVLVDSEKKPGVLNYGEIIIPGESKKEIFLSTYVCHPSMANNELSGPLVTIALAQWLQTLSNLKYTYRIVFVPENIGAIVYIKRNLERMKKNIFAGYQITCVGDENCYSYLPSRMGNTIADKVAKHVLKIIDPKYKEYSYLDRGSDESRYCSPGVDLPVASVMRSKYGEYPEYHTSLDNLNFISSKGLSGSLELYKKILTLFENNFYPKSTVICEPQLGKRKMYPLLTNAKILPVEVMKMMDFISYCDGTKSLLDVAEIIDDSRYYNSSFFDLKPLADKLIKEGLIESINPDN